MSTVDSESIKERGMNNKLEDALRTILDYVRRENNRVDDNKEVADAAEIVETYLNSFDL